MNLPEIVELQNTIARRSRFSLSVIPPGVKEVIREALILKLEVEKLKAQIAAGDVHNVTIVKQRNAADNRANLAEASLAAKEELLTEFRAAASIRFRGQYRRIEIPVDLVRLIEDLQTMPGRITADEGAELKRLRRQNHELTAQLGRGDNNYFQAIKNKHKKEIAVLADELKAADKNIEKLAATNQTIRQQVAELHENKGRKKRMSERSLKWIADKLTTVDGMDELLAILDKQIDGGDE